MHKQHSTSDAQCIPFRTSRCVKTTPGCANDPVPPGHVRIATRTFALMCAEFVRRGGSVDELLAINPDLPAFQVAARHLRGWR